MKINSRFLMKTRLGIFGIITLSSVACRHIPVDEIPLTANPTEEIDKLNNDRAAAVNNQVDVLAPTSYRSAADALKRAEESRDSGADTRVILNHVATSKAYLKKANEAAVVSRSALPDVLEARSYAVSAEAPKFVEKDFEAADKELRAITEEIEDNDLESAKDRQEHVANLFRGLEIKAIKVAKLTTADSTIQQAVDEGAKKNAPRSLTEAEDLLKKANSFIETNPRDKNAIQSHSDAATASANRLLEVSRQAKVADNVDSEALVLERLALNKTLQDEKAAALQAQQALTAQTDKKQGELSKLESENRQLATQAALTDRLARAKAQFTESEADVYQDGNRLIVRLKKVAFPSGKANLTPDSLPLLGKVQTVVDELGPSNITVEGHTDSVGAKAANQRLSEIRAAAIGSYLRINRDQGSTIKVVGFGDQKPIAANNTAAGRAQNRRVDIVIEPQEKSLL